MENAEPVSTVVHEKREGVEKNEGTDSVPGRDGCDVRTDASGLFAQSARPYVKGTPVQIQQI